MKEYFFFEQRVNNLSSGFVLLKINGFFDEILHFCPLGISEGHILKGKNAEFREKTVDSERDEPRTQVNSNALP